MNSSNELLTYLRTKLGQADATSSKQLRKQILAFVDSSARYLIIQIQYMRNVMIGTPSPDMNPVGRLVEFYGETMGLEAPVYAYLGESYYSTGAFIYYKKYGQRLGTEYFIVSADLADPAVFWVLSAHEIAHCWLSRKDLVDQICNDNPLITDKTNADQVESHVEEALCDVIATRFAGPAYPRAFASKLWVHLTEEYANRHPLYSFRLECMAQALDDSRFYDEAGSIREMMDEYKMRPWKDEVISWSLDRLLDLTTKMPPVTSAKTGRSCYDFNQYWDMICEASPASDPAIMKRASDSLLSQLEG